jgi:ribosome-binding factor A
MSQRTDRLDELLRQEIGAMLEREVADPRVGFATVTQVETAPDLRHARVWVSVIGGVAERAETVAALERAMVFVRRELGKRLRLKRIPDLHVRLDDSIERGTRVLRLIDSLETGDVPPEPVAGESLPTPRRGAPGTERMTPGGGGPGVTSPDTGAPTGPIVDRDPAEDLGGFGSAAAEYAARLDKERQAARSTRKARPTNPAPVRRGGARGGARGGDRPGRPRP